MRQFSSPEAALLWVSTKNRGLWPEPIFWACVATPEIRDSRTYHARPQRPRSFWSAPRIATSGQVKRHSGFEWLCKHHRLRPEPIRFLKLDSEHAQSDGKSVNSGLPVLDLVRGFRGRDSWCWPKGTWPLWTRIGLAIKSDCPRIRKLSPAKGRDSWCWPKGARPLRTRTSSGNVVPRVFVPYCACRLNKFSWPLVKGNEDHKYDGGLTGFWFIFSAFAFSPFLIFLLQFTFFYRALLQFENSLESIIETGNSYHGAKCKRRRKFSVLRAFRSNFWAFVHISRSTSLISPADLSARDANFGQEVDVRSEGQRKLRALRSDTGAKALSPPRQPGLWKRDCTDLP